jgi:hypothetical protein
MSAMTFSNATVYTSRATSRGVTQLLVAPRSLARPKELVLSNIVWGELFLKFYFKKVKKIKKFNVLPHTRRQINNQHIHPAIALLLLRANVAR